MAWIILIGAGIALAMSRMIDKSGVKKFDKKFWEGWAACLTKPSATPTKDRYLVQMLRSDGKTFQNFYRGNDGVQAGKIFQSLAGIGMRAVLWDYQTSATSPVKGANPSGGVFDVF